jgi:hypothetical protein
MPVDNAVGGGTFIFTGSEERSLNHYKSMVMNGLRFQRKYAKSHMCTIQILLPPRVS